MSPVASMQPMTWVAAVYSLVLLAAAYGIDYMARRASHALERRQNPGFVYHEDNDAWLCPEDEWLWPKSFDPENRVMRYQAPAHVCGTCLKVSTCTIGGGGREVIREVDPWPASEAARFHRGIACTVTAMAIIWPIASLLSMPPMLDAIVLALVLALVIGASVPLWLFLRRSPADPTGVLHRDADTNAADRQRSAAAYLARTSTYWSEKRRAAERVAALDEEIEAQHRENRRNVRTAEREIAADARRVSRVRAPKKDCAEDCAPAEPRTHWASDRRRAAEALERTGRQL